METCTVETALSAGPAARAVPGRRRATLTHSSLESFMRCPREFELAYRELLAPVAYPPALALGSAFHRGSETLHHGLRLEEALRVADEVIEGYVARAALGLSEERARELDDQGRGDRARVHAMLRGWYERHFVPCNGDAVRCDRDLDVVETEVRIERPLVNPQTNRTSRLFLLAGRVDGIVHHREENFRRGPSGVEGWHILETKTTGLNIEEFVETMGRSSQIAIYQHMAERSLGPDPRPLLGTVVDVVAKPKLRPRSGESLETFETRLVDLYRGEPDAMFRRVVLALDRDRMDETLADVWRIARQIRDAERHGFARKSGPSCRGPFGWCRFRRLCWENDRTGYVSKHVAHEELIDEA